MIMNADVMFALIWLGIGLLPMLIGLIAGVLIEQAHWRSILRREAEFENILLTNTKGLPLNGHGTMLGMCSGSVVLSVDSFRRLTVLIRMLGGGRIGTLSRILERGRREAVLRMLAQASTLQARFSFLFLHKIHRINHF